MKEFVITTPDELRTLIEDAVKASVPTTNQSRPEPDTVTLTAALDILREHGYPTSKGKLYKLTSANLMPHRKYGNKLVFSRRELLSWADSQTRAKPCKSEASLALAESARRKR